jgi:short-subunit dehydrogenase
MRRGEEQTMSGSTPLQGRHALVTDASSGLGADLARELDRRGASLLMVARREDRLRALKRELVDRHGVTVDVAVLDLTAGGAPEELHRRTNAGRPLDVLVNNAGYGLYGRFVELDWEREHNMLELDMIVPVHLTKLFLPGMLERDLGHVLDVASIGAYQPSPLYASYSAAKSFLLNFTEALSYGLRGTGVHATALAPGWWPTSSSRSSVRRQPATSGAAGWTARRWPASAWTPC